MLKAATEPLTAEQEKKPQQQQVAPVQKVAQATAQ